MVRFGLICMSARRTLASSPGICAVVQISIALISRWETFSNITSDLSSYFAHCAAGRKNMGLMCASGAQYCVSSVTPTISKLPAYFWSRSPKWWPIGFAILEEFSGESLVDHRDQASRGVVLLGKTAAGDDLRADRVKVTGTDAIPRGTVFVAAGRRRRLPFDVDTVAPVITFHGTVKGV